MHLQALSQLDKNPEWRHLLTAYHARQMLSQDGWVDRVFELSGVEDNQLSKFHGRLIALGLLEFELGGRGEGMRYQVSTLGRQALRGGVPSDFESDEVELDVEAEAA
jgi:hypothetical protein